MVGPKYVKPTAPIAPDYKEAPGGAKQGEAYKEAGPWQPAKPSDTASKGDWWTIFNDPQLNELEPQIATANQTIKAAAAVLVQARAQIKYNHSFLYPTIGTAPAGPGPAHLRCPAVLPRHPAQQRLRRPAASPRHQLRGRSLGPHPAHHQRIQGRGSGQRSRSPDRPAQPAGRARHRLLPGPRRRRPGQAPRRHREELRGGLPHHQQPLRRWRSAGVRRRPGQDPAAERPRAGERHHHPARPVRARHRRPARPSARQLHPQADAAQ